MTNATYTNPDYGHVTPYLSVKGAPEFIDYAVAHFGAVAGLRMDDESGAIVHAEMKIGESTIMLTEDCETLRAYPAALYVYVPDVDATHAAVVADGCTSTEEPTDKPYGDRTAGVVDGWGIRWYLATHL